MVYMNLNEELPGCEVWLVSRRRSGVGRGSLRCMCQDIWPSTIATGADLVAVVLALYLVIARRRPEESPDPLPPDSSGTADTS
jgi:hypothetical protein